MDTEPAKPPPLQFSLRAIFIATMLLAALFGTLRWLGVSARAGSIILLILLLGVAAASGLVAAIAAMGLGDVLKRVHDSIYRQYDMFMEIMPLEEYLREFPCAFDRI